MCSFPPGRSPRQTARRRLAVGLAAVTVVLIGRTTPAATALPTESAATRPTGSTSPTGSPVQATPVLPGATSWPLAGEPVVLAGFDPPATTYGPGHRGVDLAGRLGANVLAVAAGTVTFAGPVAGVPVVVVDHGTLRSTYQPVTATLPVGSRVAAGDPVGRLVGGHCPGEVCLHWGVLRGLQYLDPLTVVAPVPAELTLLPAGAERRAAARQRARALVADLAATRGPDPVVTALAGGSGRFGLVPAVTGPVSSPYGLRLHPLLHVWKLHDGTDFAAPCGAVLRAPGAGVVTARSLDTAYGNRLFVDHGSIDGTHVVTALNHASDYTVAVGAHVQAGQPVGHVGATGYATGCHLHLMAWLDGRLVDPQSVL